MKSLLGAMTNATFVWAQKIALIAGLLVVSSTSIASSGYPTDSFSIPEGAYSATHLEDQDHISIMDFSGNYNRQLEGGQFNRAARAVIAKEFFRKHPDKYDFIVTFSSFEFETGNAVAFYHGAKNDTRGIGLPVFDNTQMYGSQGKLQGFIDMAAVSRYTLNPFDPKFEWPLQVLAHEVLHRWGSFVRFKDTDGNPSENLLGPDSSHWSFFLDSKASVQYGHQWQSNADGTFTAVASNKFYSPLDLYLMGFYSPAQVPDFFLVDSADERFNRADYPVKGTVLAGTKQIVRISDIQALEGPRIPDAANSQKEFRFAFVYVKQAGEELNKNHIAGISSLRRAFIERFSIMTGGRGIAHIYPEAMPIAELGSDDGIQVDGNDAIRIDNADAEDAFTWLRGQLDTTKKFWGDKNATRLRDTTTVYSVLTSLDPTFASGANTQTWLREQEVNNTDSSARRLMTLPTDQSSAEKLIALQGASGGWGLLAHYSSTPLDTALAVEALAHAGFGAENVRKGIQYLLQSQNADGGWPESSTGASAERATAAAITALAVDGSNPTVVTATELALSWLTAKQHGDGGFGASKSTVNETAEVILSVLASRRDYTLNMGAALQFISERQRTSGNWEGSVYTTAIAAKVLRATSLTNLKLTAVAAHKLSVFDGERVNLSLTIINDSPLVSPASSVQFYKGDPKLGGIALLAPATLPELTPNSSVSVNQSWDTLDQPGEFVIYAVIDPHVLLSERSRTDNTGSITIDVKPAPAGIDLEFNNTEFLITPEHPTNLPVQLGVSATLRNLGQTAVENVVVQLWRGLANPTTGTLVGEEIISLPARTSGAVTFVADLTASGATRYTVVADPSNAITEVSKDNNSATKIVETASALDVGIIAEDIVVETLPVILHEDVTIKTTIRNRGTLPAANFRVNYIIQNEEGSKIIATNQLTLEAGEAKTLNIVWRADFFGQSNFIVEIDPDNLIVEADEDNNFASIILSTQQLNGVNLAVTTADLDFSPTPALEGLGVTLAAKITNTGTLPATAVPVVFYDGDPSAGGVVVGSTIVAELTPGEQRRVEVIWPEIPSAAERLIFVRIDPDNQISEFNEIDNSAFKKLIVNTLPDLAVSEGSLDVTPPFPKLGDTAVIKVKVNNLGKQSATNILVRAYQGNPEAGGTEIGSGVQIAAIDGAGVGEAVFSLAVAQAGVESIYVVVDPDQAIREKTTSNNIASKKIAVQDGNFYVTERYISPDNNGIKDSTNFFFRLETPDTVSVVLIDHRGRELRKFSQIFESATTGNVIWNGLTDAGSVVLDGQYQFVVKNSKGIQLGGSSVEVDTNRSSLVDALDTQFQLDSNLNCAIGQTYNFNAYSANNNRTVGDKRIVYSSDNETIYFTTLFIPRNVNGVLQETDDTTLYPSGIYRANRNGTDVVSLALNKDISVGSVRKIHLSSDGLRLAVITVTPEDNFQVWTMNAKDGSGRRLAFDSGITSNGYRSFKSAEFITGKYEVLIASHNNSVYSLDVVNVSENPNIAVKHVGTLPSDHVESVNEYMLHILPSPTSHHMAIQLVADTYFETYGSYADFFTTENAYLYLVNPDSATNKLLGHRAHGAAWSPNGKYIAAGDPVGGGVAIFDVSGNKTQSIRLPRAYYLPDLYSYLLSALPADFRQKDAILGVVSGIDWNSDGTELAFVYEDYTEAFITYNLWVEAGYDGYGYGGGSIDELNLEQFKFVNSKGIYVADIKTNQLTKHADIPPILRRGSRGEEHLYLEKLGKDNLGNLISPEGLPIVSPWFDLFEQRAVKWMTGSRAVLISGYRSTLSLNASYIVGFDSATTTRQVFSERTIDQYGQVLPTATGKYFNFYSYDDADRCPANDATAGHRQVASLLNLTAGLRVIRSAKSGGILLEGTATDKNIEYMALEFAPIEQPESWQFIMPPATTNIVDKKLTTWVPPDKGSYFVRLTVKDRAGNSKSIVKRTSLSERPTITNIYRQPAYISPNSDGIKDNVKIHFKVLEPVNLDVSIFNDSGTLVRKIERSYTDIGSDNELIWDGRSDHGQRVTDGVYQIRIQNYDFYVEVDTEFPIITNNTKSLLYPFSPYEKPCNPAGGKCLIGIDTELSFTGKDSSSLPEVWSEFKRDDAAQWQTLDLPIKEYQGVMTFPLSHGVKSAERTLEEWVTGAFKVTAEDKAGNRSILQIPSLPKRNQVYVTNAHYSEEYNGINVVNRTLASPFELPEAPATSASLTTKSTGALIFNVVETLPENIISAEVLYKEVGSNTALISAPITDFGVIKECENNKRCFSPIGSSLHNQSAGHFVAAWNFSPLKLKSGVQYRAYLRLTDTTLNSVLSNSVLFGGNTSLNIELEKVTAGCFDSSAGACGLYGRNTAIVATTTGSWNQFSSLNLYIQSNEDKRFTREILVESTFIDAKRSISTPDKNFFVFPADTLLACNQYNVKMVFVDLRGEQHVVNKPLSPTCMQIDAYALPLYPPNCNDPATNTIVFKMKVLNPDSASTQTVKLQLLTLSKLNGAQQEKDIVFNVNNPSFGKDYVHQLSTTDYSEGNASFLVEIRDVNGKVDSRVLSVPIVHTAPSMDVTHPLSGGKYCAKPYLNKLTSETAFGLELQGKSQSTGAHTYNIYTRYASTETWNKTFCQPYSYLELLNDNYPLSEPSDSCDPDKNLLSSSAMINNSLTNTSRVKGTLGSVSLNKSGDTEILFESFNWSGARYCSAVSIAVDAEVEGLFVKPIAGAENAKLKNIDIYSPNTPQGFDVVGWQYTIGESATVTIDIVELALVKITDKGPEFTEGAVISSAANALAVLPGTREIHWGAANTAHDGYYRAKIVTTDGCGITASHQFDFEIDGTPPNIALSHPTANANLGLLVEPIGSISDKNNASYVLSFSRDGDIYVPFASSLGLGNWQEQILGRWNTLGLTGTWYLQLSARDMLGNASTLVREVSIPERLNLISALTLENDVISPNGDGKLDSAVVTVRFEQDVRADVNVTKDDQLLGQLVQDQIYLAGTHRIVWNASQPGGAPYSEGVYQVQISAHRDESAAAIQTESVTVTIDVTPPMVVVNNLVDGLLGLKKINPVTNILGNINDKYFSEYGISLIETPDGASSFLLDGGSIAPRGIISSIDAQQFSGEGFYKFQITANDIAANTTTLLFQALVDTTPPVIQIEDPLANSYARLEDSVVKVNGTITEENLASYTLSLVPKSEGVLSTFSQEFKVLPSTTALGTISLAGLADGNYQLEVTATDLVGWATLKAVPIVIDNTLPTAQIRLPDESGYITKPSLIRGTANDAHYLQHELLFAKTSTGNLSYSSLLLANRAVDSATIFSWESLPEDGAYTLKLIVNDAAGNIVETTKSLIIDTKPPAKPQFGTVTLQKDVASVALQWSSVNDTDLAGYRIYRSGTLIAELPIGVVTYIDVNVSEGNYLYQVAAIDKAGLESEFESYEMVVDVTPPKTSLLRPLNSSVLSGIVSVVGTAASVEDFKEYRLEIGKDQHSLHLISQSSLPVIGGELGQWDTSNSQVGVSYLIRLSAEDIHGNKGISEAVVTVDNNPPQAPLNLAATVINGNDVQLSWDRSLDLDIQGYLLFRNDRLVNAPNVLIGDLIPYAILGTNYEHKKVVDGVHSYFVVAVDQAGNLSDPSESIELTIDIRAPHATFVSPNDTQAFEDSVYLAVEVVDEDAAEVLFQYRPQGEQWTTIGVDTTHPFNMRWDITLLPIADYELQAVTKDFTANIDPSPEVRTIYKRDLTPPATLEAPNISVLGGNVTITWQASDAVDLAGYIVFKRIDAEGQLWQRVNADLIDSLQYVDTGGSDGKYRYSVVAVDESGNLADRSMASAAIVFTPQVASPYTPTVDSSIALNGVTLGLSQVNLKIYAGSTLVGSKQITASEDGKFTLTSIALEAENNYFELTATSPAGFISKTVIFDVQRGTLPNQVTGLVATLDSNGEQVDLSWNKNSDSDLLGYKIYRDGDSITPSIPMMDILPLLPAGISSTGSGIERIVDHDENNEWYWPSNITYIDFQLSQPSLVSDLNILWYEPDFSLKQYSVMAWTGERYVTVATLDYTLEPKALHKIQLARPYVTDKIRIVAPIDFFNIFLKEVFINTLALANDVDYFSDLPPDGFRRYSVSAINTKGFEGQRSDEVEIAAGDIVAPDPVVISGEVNGGDVNITWTASSSNDVNEYRIFRNGVLVAIKDNTTLSYADLSLPNGVYAYQVRPVDDVGNLGNFSNSFEDIVNQPLLPAPVNLTLEVDGSIGHLVLAWEAAPESKLPAGYSIYRATNTEEFTLLTEVVSNSFRDTNLTIGMEYRYHVRARDELGNRSAPSNEVAGQPADNLAPSTPEIFRPTISGTTLVVAKDKINVAGLAEPGSNVSLIRNNSIVATQRVGMIFPELTQNGNEIIGIAESPDGQFAVLMDTGNGSRNLYRVENDEIELINYESAAGAYAKDIIWAESKLLLADYSSLIAVDSVSGHVENFPPLFEGWGEISKLVSYDASSNSVIFIGHSEGNTGVFSYNLTSKKLTVLRSYPLEGYTYSSLSPDKRVLGLIENYSTEQRKIRLFNIETFEERVQFVSGGDSPEYQEPISWSYDGQEVLVTASNARGQQQVILYNLGSTDANVIASSENENYAHPVWSFDGKSIAYEAYGNSNTHVILKNIETSQTEVLFSTPSTSRLSHLNWSYNNTVLYGQNAAGIHAKRLPGQFSFTNIGINRGENVITTFSADDAGNESEISSAILVNLTEKPQPDFLVTVQMSSLVYQLNAKAIASITVTNIGTVLSPASQVDFVSKNENGIVTTIASNLAIKSLAAGESVTLPLEWTFTEAGEHSLVAVIDADNKVSEISELNNLWTSEITVVASAKPFVKVSLQPSTMGGLSFVSQEAMLGNVIVTNAGNTFSGSIVVSIVDADGYLVKELSKNTIQKLSFGATHTLPIAWNTGATFSGEYLLRVELFDSQSTLIDEAEKLFLIVDDVRLTAGITTNSAIYSANTDVLISTTLANTAGNSLFAGGEILVTIGDATGEPLESFRQDIGEILPGDLLKILFKWNTGLTPPNSYQVTARLWNNSGHEMLVALAEFEIKGGTPQIRGQFDSLPDQIGIGESLAVPFSITNASNTSLENVELLILLTNPVSGEILRSTKVPVSLDYDKSITSSVMQDLADLPLGSYHLTLSYLLSSANGLHASQLDRKTITIADNRGPRVQFITPEPGAIVSGQRTSVIVEAVDDETAIGKVEIKLDGGDSRIAFRDIENTNAYRLDLKGISEGAHSMTLSAIDTAGNISNVDTRHIVIDNTAPEIVISGVLDGDFYTKNVTPIITINDLSVVNTSIELNGETFISGTTLTADNLYRLVVTAEDVAGNTARLVTVFEISKIEAAILIDGISDNAYFNYPVQPTIQTSGVLSGSVIATVNNEVFTSGTTIENEGNYTLRVTAKDLSGLNIERELHFTLDYTAPETPQILYPLNGASVKDPVIELKGLADPFALVTMVASNEETFSATVDQDGHFTFANVHLSEGANTLILKVRDLAGNVSNSTALLITYSITSDVTVSANFIDGTRVLIWVPEKKTGNFYGDVDTFVELLTSAYDDIGINFFVANSPEIFLEALRSQQYNAINMVNLDAAPLLNQGDVFTEVQAAVLAGTGLVVFNTKPESLGIMREILGARTRGRLANTTRIVFENEVISGEYNWSMNEFALSVSLEGGLPIGKIYNKCGNKVCSQPALVANQYGKGHTVLALFSFTDVNSVTEAKKLITDVTNHVLPNEYLLLPSSLHTISWGIDGVDIDSSLIVDQSLSSGLNYFNVYDGSFEDKQAKWEVSVQNERVNIVTSVFTQAVKGTHTIESRIFRDIVSSSTLEAEDTLIVEVQKSLSELKNELVTAIEALTGPSSDKKNRKTALDNVKLAVANPLTNRRDAEIGIQHLSNSLTALTQIEADHLLVQTAELIKIYQSVWTTQGDDSGSGKCNLIDPEAIKYPLWNSTSIYTGGELVNYKNVVWKAKWWNIGAGPESPDAPWWLISDVEYPWHNLRIYEIGDELNYNGRRWRAQWWVTRDAPGTHPAWLDIGPSSCIQ